MQIYLVLIESNVDGEHFVDAVPCENMKRAKEVINACKEELLSESVHYSKPLDELKNDDGFVVIDKEDRFSISDNYDDYWEDYHIIKKVLEV